MAKVFIGVGHGGNDSGAVGNGLKEKDITLKIATASYNYLKAYGVDVQMSRYRDENDTVTEEVKECNAFNPDLAFDVHINAGGGDGFEAFHTIDGGIGETLALNIESEVKALGQNSRGVKTRKNSSGSDYYAFIRNTKCPAVICELGFIDNANDLKDFDEDHELKVFGEAYAKGVLKTLGITQAEQPIQPTKPAQDTETSSSPKNQTVATGQQHSINFTGHSIATDGIWGPATKANAIRCVQHAMNLDYNAGLTVDGIWGTKSNSALGNHWVKLCETQYMVTALEILLMLRGYDPNGVECPGFFGNGLKAAVQSYQKDAGLTVDGVAGKNTFKSLMSV